MLFYNLFRFFNNKIIFDGVRRFAMFFAILFWKRYFIARNCGKNYTRFFWEKSAKRPRGVKIANCKPTIV